MAGRGKLIDWESLTPRAGTAGHASNHSKNIPREWFAQRIVDFDLWLVCSGESVLIDDEGRHTPLTRGSVLWLKPGDVFELRVDRSGRYTNSYIHFDMIDRKGALVPYHKVRTLPTVGSVHDVHYFESTMQRITFLQYHQKTGNAETQQAITELVSQLLMGLLHDYRLAHVIGDSGDAAGIHRQHARTISEAMTWLYLNPDSELSAAALARKYGYSERHFGRIFRQVTGKTPAQALIAARIDHARKMLAVSSMNVTEIAESLRYSNVFYFSTQFKHHTGMSPVDFRERALGKS